MYLNEALDGISAKSYFEFCNLKYSGLKFHGFDKMEFNDLPPSMQLGLKRLILSLYQTQKITFFYELEYVLQCLKRCGICYRDFFKSCNVNPSFYSNKYLSDNNFCEYLLTIRIQIIKIINRLFDFMLFPKTKEHELQHLRA